MDIEQVACASCRVSFEDAQSQRAHYKTDFHRYNLKRKVAELPPISFEDFEARLAASQKKEEVDESRACTACNKKFSSDNAYQQHLRSRKHRDKVGSTGNSTAAVAVSPNRGALGPAGDNATYRDGSTGAIDSNPAAAAAVDPEDLARKAKVLNIDRDDLTGEEQQQLDALLSKATFLTEKQCIFCRWEGKDFEGCLDHVTAKHSFFIPDLEYVTNIQDLYMYLSQKVSVGMVCLWCNKQFQSLEAVRGHMEDKGHWKMLYEDETAEYDDYYDFSSTYPEGAQVPGIEGDPQDPGTRELILPPGASRQPVGVSDSGYDLVLSDGTLIGHRSLHRYYKQRFRPEQTSPAVLMSRLFSKYKQLGYGDKWKGPSKVPEKSTKIMKKHHLQVGVKANKLQHHFRLQNPI